MNKEIEINAMLITQFVFEAGITQIKMARNNLLKLELIRFLKGKTVAVNLCLNKKMFDILKDQVNVVFRNN